MEGSRAFDPDGLNTSLGPRGIGAVGAFLVFGATMALLAGVTLAWPGTFLDRMWALNPVAWVQLAPFGKTIGVPFLLLSCVLVVAAVGWFRRRKWGWVLAVFVIAVQVAGDLVNLLRGDFVRGGTGAVIAGALLAYFLRPKVRAVFEGRP